VRLTGSYRLPRLRGRIEHHGDMAAAAARAAQALGQAGEREGAAADVELVAEAEGVGAAARSSAACSARAATAAAEETSVMFCLIWRAKGAQGCLKRKRPAGEAGRYFGTMTLLHVSPVGSSVNRVRLNTHWRFKL